MKNVFKSEDKIPIKTQKQLRFPSGQEGRVIGKQLYEGNSQVINEAIKEIDIKSGIRICDVGCGPGYSLNKMSTKIKSGEIIGVDPSTEMCEMAIELNAELVSKGLVKVIKGKTPRLPLDNDYFDYLLLINVVYFWKNIDLYDHFSDLYRVLNRDGKIIIYMTSKGSLKERVAEEKIFYMYSTSTVINILKEVGFINPKNRLIERENKQTGYIITATKK